MTALRLKLPGPSTPHFCRCAMSLVALLPHRVPVDEWRLGLLKALENHDPPGSHLRLFEHRPFIISGNTRFAGRAKRGRKWVDWHFKGDRSTQAEAEVVTNYPPEVVLKGDCNDLLSKGRIDAKELWRW